MQTCLHMHNVILAFFATCKTQSYCTYCNIDMDSGNSEPTTTRKYNGLVASITEWSKPIVFTNFLIQVAQMLPVDVIFNEASTA